MNENINIAESEHEAEAVVVPLEEPFESTHFTPYELELLYEPVCRE